MSLHNNTRLREGIDLYIDRITVAGQSEFSIKTARYALDRFYRESGDLRKPNPYIHLITPEIVDTYCYGPTGIRRRIRAVTFNRYRSVLKLFFDYGCLMRWCDTNPVAAVLPARPDTPVARLMLNAGELLALLDHSTHPIERVAMSIGMNTGLRANDIRHLTVFDMSLASGGLHTEIRKTNKLDTKPITMELQRELVTWLDIYAAWSGLPDRGHLPNDWLLVPSYHPHFTPGKPMSLRPTSMHTHPWRLVQRPLVRMGYPSKGEGFHTLRRSSARAFFDFLRDTGEGRDHALMIVKEFLNHSSTMQTEHYLGLNRDRTLRDAALKDRPFLSILAQAEQSRVGSAVSLLKGVRSA